MDYSYFDTQGSFIEKLEGPYGFPERKLESTVYKANSLPALLILFTPIMCVLRYNT